MARSPAVEVGLTLWTHTRGGMARLRDWRSDPTGRYRSRPRACATPGSARADCRYAVSIRTVQECDSSGSGGSQPPGPVTTKCALHGIAAAGADLCCDGLFPRVLLRQYGAAGRCWGIPDHLRSIGSPLMPPSRLGIIPHNLVRAGRLAEASPGRGGGIEDHRFFERVVRGTRALQSQCRNCGSLGACARSSC
jgi:hypothetical protein